MIKVGITGQNGFIGSHLYRTLSLLYKNSFALVQFDKTAFEVADKMDEFVGNCDAIVHLAGVNRHESQEELYRLNLSLTSKLIDSLRRTKARPHILFSSSSQESRDNLYGKSKKEARENLIAWANESGAVFTGFIIPNVFGPFGKPYYNSVISTFCHQLCAGETPGIQTDAELNLIYVGELAEIFVEQLKNPGFEKELLIAHTSSLKVSSVLQLLSQFKTQYFDRGIIPSFGSAFERNLFNTFRSFIDHKSFFPVKLQPHTDERGSFVEIIKLESGGQVSFSTTKPQVTRGNHFHTRKIERFAVIRGEALIQLRRIDNDAVINFTLSGTEPAYVDMPIWYTHNIKNIGTDDLYTIFWINEFFDPTDPDTYFENV
jgi:UDP-2-acetamido-2,6-beta-L-arabino-hexul-4-ose reductase